MRKFGRSERIRTSDPLVPNEAASQEISDLSRKSTRFGAGIFLIRSDVSAPKEHRTAANDDRPPQKETAATAGGPRGGKLGKEFNLRVREYIAARLDAIAEEIDPLDCPVEALDGLVELADALSPDVDLEPDHEAVEDDREPFDIGGGR